MFYPSGYCIALFNSEWRAIFYIFLSLIWQKNNFITAENTFFEKLDSSYNVFTISHPKYNYRFSIFRGWLLRIWRNCQQLSDSKFSTNHYEYVYCRDDVLIPNRGNVTKNVTKHWQEFYSFLTMSRSFIMLKENAINTFYLKNLIIQVTSWTSIDIIY